MITQYTDSYSAASSDIQNLVANKIALLDQYILMQTGQYEYTALVYNPNTKKCIEYTISRISSSGYSNQYTVSEAEADFEYTVSNEYYVFSNVGYGRSLDLPVYEGVQSHSLIIICIVLLFAIVFKGALFTCFRRRR
ncbi:MAG: hypothetical protein E7521_08590 [Ruminococcaceae bacterium]|nr:hypothetical protein [Oscillospiraceae bacterium]